MPLFSIFFWSKREYMADKCSIKGNVFLFTAALIWGCALVAQKAGMSHLGPFGFTAIRCCLGGVALLPLVHYISRRDREDNDAHCDEKKSDKKQTVIGSISCGVMLTALVLFQQFGLPYTTVGKAGFITALYILITPLIGLVFGRKPGKFLWIGVAVGLIGMYMLCLFEGISGLSFGDIMMLGAAIAASGHILVINYFVQKVEPIKLSAYQFIISGVICIIPMFVFEDISVQAVIDCAVPILYAGLVSCGAGYTCQVIGQKWTDPNLASLILSLETVFCLIAGMIFFHEKLSFNEYIGCMLMFIAIFISQIKPNNEETVKIET